MSQFQRPVAHLHLQSLCIFEVEWPLIKKIRKTEVKVNKTTPQTFHFHLLLHKCGVWRGCRLQSRKTCSEFSVQMMIMMCSSLSLKIAKVSYMEADGKALIFSPSTPGVFVWFWFVSFSVFIYLFIFAEELQKQLLEQVELRKKLEREFQHLKGKLISATVHVKANVPPLCDWGQNISLNISNPPQQ